MVDVQQGFHGLCVDFAIDMQAADRAFKLIERKLAVKDLDLGDEPVEPQANGGIRNPIRRGEFLERSRSKHKTLEEREVFFIQQVCPSVGIRHSFYLTYN